MINDYGFLCLCNETEELLLDYGMNMIACHEGKAIKIKPEQGMSSVACIINITNDNIEIMPIMPLILNGDNVFISTPIKENDILQIGSAMCKLIFRASGFKQLDALVEQYLDGQLPPYLSVANLFVEYAKHLNITDKQAAFILASIDIPELELKET